MSSYSSNTENNTHEMSHKSSPYLCGLIPKRKFHMTIKKTIKIIHMQEQDYHISITVDATAHDAFESINSVTKWWTENLEGSSQKLNDEFTVRFGDVHYSKQIIS
jgi:hypothetical protein